MDARAGGRPAVSAARAHEAGGDTSVHRNVYDVNRPTAAPEAGPGRRPVFEVLKGELAPAVKFALERLAADPRVYVRGGALVTVRPWDEEDAQQAEAAHRRVRRAVGTPVIVPLSSPRLAAVLSEISAWDRYDARARASVPIDPPPPVVAAVHTDGEWLGVRPLVGVTDVPVLREDGSVSDRPGYDEVSCLIYRPSGAVPHIPARPTRDDALDAARALLEVIFDMPFVDELHRAGWLAGLLGAVARPLLPTVPLVAFSANSPGVGKTLATRSIGLIATGRDMVTTAWVADDDEMRKRITAHLMSGDVLITIDNVPGGGSVGWPSIDRALTSTELSDRVLGESRSFTAVNRLVWFCTGNNLSVRGDTARRVLLVCLDSPLERPEARSPSEFKHPDLPAWVLAERPRLLGAALTVLAAFLRAGCPGGANTTVGSFEDWSMIVAGAIRWLGLGDVTGLVAARTS